MGLFKAISEWSATRYDRRIAKMEEKGLCPDCRGHGFDLYPSDFMIHSTFHCDGCDGNGTFSTWSQNQGN